MWAAPLRAASRWRTTAVGLGSQCRLPPQRVAIAVATYFTNTDTLKRDDPYAVLGLSWGDGATLTEIKQAYKRKALEWHPDRQLQAQSKQTSPAAAARQFLALQRAYESLVHIHSHLQGVNDEQDEAWRASVWRNGDRLAVNRTDVAGVARKRPRPSASDATHLYARGVLGHPDGRGAGSHGRRRAEYLGERGSKSIASSVGRGRNKWVTPKAFTPWDGQGGAPRAREFECQPKSEPRTRE
jgi:hypothetical protein